MSHVLSGVKILDFSTLLPGPMATLLLAEVGADVIKLERPREGELARSSEPQWGKVGANFAMLNRGKKSVEVDLKNAEHIQLLEPLIRQADVLVEQFRPGVMARVGLGYEQVRAINPNIIYCSITGYGQNGPDALRAGHDLNYIADAGLLSLGYGSEAAPSLPPALIADIAGGAYPAVINILLALRARDMNGEGCHIDIAMCENVLPFTYWAYGQGLSTGHWAGNGGGKVTGQSPRYRLYKTRDNKIAAVAALEQKFWESLCDILQLDPALRDDTVDPEATGQAVARGLASKDASHWESEFAEADCCCTIMRSLEEAVDDAHLNARGVFDAVTQDSEGHRIKALPVPIQPAFRANLGVAKLSKLGEDNNLLGASWTVSIAQGG